MSQNTTIQASGAFDSQQSKHDLVQNMAKIMHCSDQYDVRINDEIDDNNLDQSDPYVQAGYVFRETLIAVGLEYEGAEIARKTFLAMRFGCPSNLSMYSNQEIELNQSQIDAINAVFLREGFNSQDPPADSE